MRRYERQKPGMVAATILVLAGLLAAFLAAGCSTTRSETPAAVAERAPATAEPVEVHVSAAMALRDALTKLAADFGETTGAKVVFNFGASGDLQAQIEQGAHADLFVSAGTQQMDALEEKGLIDADSRADLLGNGLIIAAPPDSEPALARIEDIGTAAGKIRRIAIANPDTAPAGRYAKEALETAKLWPSLQHKIILTKDVRQVLGYVETGNVDLGFAYASDINALKNAKVALRVPGNYHKPIVYPLAVLKDAKHADAAKRFAAFLRTEESMKVFEKYGFKPTK